MSITMTLIYQARYVLLLLALGAAMQQGRAQFQFGVPATVTLRVIDSYGKPLEYKVESFHATDRPDENLAPQFDGLTFKHALSGKIYEARLAPVYQDIEHPAFKQLVAVGESYTLAVFCVPKAVLLPDLSTPWPVTKLVIKPVPRGKDMWVNVRPAFGPDISGNDISETVTVSSEGTFNLHGTHGGLYVVSLYEGSRVPRLGVVEIPQFAPSNPINVTLD